MKFVKITPDDNVGVALTALACGEEALGVTLTEDIPAGHKFALRDIAEGENIIKYSAPIGRATAPVKTGAWVHTHNTKTNLDGILEYTYNPVEIPENGVIQASVIKQVKQENAIAVFSGQSGDYKYEWTIFGSDIAEPKEINLGVQISKADDGIINVVLTQADAFGFSALLSIYLNEKWDAQSATAYANDKAIASVSDGITREWDA